MRLLERRLAFKRTSPPPVSRDGDDKHKPKGVAPDDQLEIGSSLAPEQGDPSRGSASHVSPVTGSPSKRLMRQLNAINSLSAIRLKMILFGSLALAFLGPPAIPNHQDTHQVLMVEAGFFTFYFPNLFKPKGFGELSDMINSLEGQINETKDSHADTQYFWGQLERLDQVESDYPEESACAEVFPLFRELAINYIHIDYEFYLKPIELYHKYLVEFRDKWYPAGLESKAALPREWEQKLMERELDLKIEWLGKLVQEKEYQDKRARMIEIWKSIRRSLDTSLPCIYLKYGYRQIAEDINQVALEANLESMGEAMKVLVSAYKRIEKFKGSDARIIKEIEDELEKVERFTIKTRR